MDVLLMIFAAAIAVLVVGGLIAFRQYRQLQVHFLRFL